MRAETYWWIVPLALAVIGGVAVAVFWWAVSKSRPKPDD
jgi:hypothetical protein